jgi:hypothetical protein
MTSRNTRMVLPPGTFSISLDPGQLADVAHETN